MLLRFPMLVVRQNEVRISLHLKRYLNRGSNEQAAFSAVLIGCIGKLYWTQAQDSIGGQ